MTSVVVEFDRLWQTGGETPDLFDFVRQTPEVTAEQQKELVLLDQFYRWNRGVEISANTYFRNFPDLAADSEFRIELILEELGYREQQDSLVQLDKFVDQFVDDKSELQRRLSQDSSRTVTVNRDSNEPVVNPGDRIDRFEVVSELGRGEFGVVYRAHDPDLNREVAIKVPFRKHIERAGGAQEFVQEAQVVAGLDHPGIVPVYDIGKLGRDNAFVVTKLIDGQSLVEQPKPLAPREAARIVSAVARALHHAHRKGIVHRDIKPANILLAQNGTPFVVDFGLSKFGEHGFGGKQWIGTPAFMSPEQARGESHRVNGRSDIFSLGVVMFQLLVGKLPWKGNSAREIMREIQYDEVTPIRQVVDNVDRELERICLRALANQASQRYTTALDFADDLESWLEDSLEYGKENPNLTIEKAAAEDNALPSVMPRGLRSFSEEDSDFFLQLYPGPVNRLGIPDVINFWISRIHDRRPDESFSVGVVYGSSGCGKSSMLKAGVLPRVSNQVHTLYVEARSSDFELLLLQRLRQTLEGLPEDLSLAQSLQLLRTEESLRNGRKLLLVIDQFEQWLHSWDGGAEETLINAIRQCDGSNLQCLISVRDDFWMAITRFMRQLDEPLVGRVNSEGVELFDKRHARNVLIKFGKSYGCLNPKDADITRAQQEFVEQAVELLAIEEKVTPIRLSVFAEMVKGRSWSIETLEKMGGTVAIGAAFLEDSFGSSAPPQYRAHASSARKILTSLMPESGTSIKGASRSQRELCKASELEFEHQEFAEVLRILDQDLRLITPTERADSDRTDLNFSLTHDFLVPSLREWLTREKKSTWTGRTELMLAERAHEWSLKNTNRSLPTIFEFGKILALTRSRDWNESQTALIKKATSFYGSWLAIGLTFAFFFAMIAFDLNGRMQSGLLVDKLVSARVNEVEPILQQIHSYRQWAVPQLARLEEQGFPDLRPSDRERTLAFVRMGLNSDSVTRQLLERLLVADPAEHQLISDWLTRRRVLPTVARETDQLWEKISSRKKTDVAGQLRAAVALARLQPDSQRWSTVGDHLVDVLLMSEPIELGDWITPLQNVSECLLPRLEQLFRSGNPGQQRNTAYLLGRYVVREPELLANLILDSNTNQIEALADLAIQNLPSLDKPFVEALDRLTPRNVEEGWEDSKYDQYFGRLSNALSFLALRSGKQAFLEALKGSADDSLRSFLIHRFAKGVGSYDFLFKHLNSESDPAVRQAIILMLGTIPIGDFKEDAFQRIKIHFFDLYVNEPDAGVHGAVDWALRKWKFQRHVAELQKQCPLGDFDGERNWYFTSQGHRMVVIPKQDYFVGSHPDVVTRYQSEDELFTQTLRRGFAIADRETSIQQFQEFLDEHPIKPVNKTRLHKSANNIDCPIMNLTWYNAAHYCNWLSEQEGIPEDQWCYVPNEKGLYGPGMKIKPNHMELTGYQLPSSEQWYCAGRAGTATARFYGRGMEMMDYFIWNQRNSGAQAQPVATLLPNRFGIFDLIGNVNEWLGDRRFPENSEASDEVRNNQKFMTTNGSWRVNERRMRNSAIFNVYEPDRDELATNVRPARMIHWNSKPNGIEP